MNCRLLLLAILPILLIPVSQAQADTFSYTVGDTVIAQMAGTASATCSSTGFDLLTADWQTFANDSLLGTDPSCTATAVEWDISSLPSSTVITSANLRIDVEGAVGANNCDLSTLTTQPTSLTSTAANAKILFDEIFAGAAQTGLTECATTGDDKVIALNSAFINDIQNAIDISQTWYAIGIKLPNQNRPTSSTYNTYGLESNSKYVELEIIYNVTPPDAVDDLTAIDVTGTGVTLQWTIPNLNNGTLSGYMINYTTPHSNDPLTIITPDTMSASTQYGVSGLTPLTDYSFRVSAVTDGGRNDTGNVFNTTTTAFAPANFTIGFINVNSTNTDTLDIFYDRQEINSTASFLNVTYPNTYELACNLHYKYANTDANYTSLNTYAVTATENQTSFIFNGIQNEIIDVYCYDQNTLNGAQYLITISDFPLLQQIQGFQNGEFGTSGNFGAFDLITLLVIIISMIGFNKVNESVGGIISIMILGATHYFGIITIPTVIFGVLAVVIMLIVTTTRKQ